MTHEEIKTKLTEKHQEELADQNSYMELSEHLREIHPEASKIFKDIAYEESTHAAMLKHIIDKI